jgi:hypothetical protein
MMHPRAQENWINRRQKLAARREREAQSPALGVTIRRPHQDTVSRPRTSIPQDVADHNSRVRDNA